MFDNRRRSYAVGHVAHETAPRAQWRIFRAIVPLSEHVLLEQREAEVLRQGDRQIVRVASEQLRPCASEQQLTVQCCVSCCLHLCVFYSTRKCMKRIRCFFRYVTLLLTFVAVDIRSKLELVGAYVNTVYVNPLNIPTSNTKHNLHISRISRHETQRELTVVHEEWRDLRKQTYANGSQFLAALMQIYPS